MSDRRFNPGDRIGDFTVLHPCGAGAFGQVYLVRGDDGATRALKVLSADRRSERELDGLLRFRRVEHPNLLRIDRLSTLPDGTIFYTMDAADNAATSPDYAPDTLARRMCERAPLPPEELKRIMSELASGLAELHRSHLLHRDIKPENILFVNGRATLADAGAVGEAGGKTLVGTPDYLSPDVCLQKRAFAATDDCYALGKVLYSALTGEAPRKFPSTPHTLGPEAAALFEAAVRACTPPGVSAYRFRELVEHPEPPRRKRRIAYASAAVAALCLVLIGVAAALTVRKRTSETPQTTTVTPPPTPKTAPAPEVRKRPAETVATPTPTPEELLVKYARSAGEQRIVDRWLAEYVAWLTRINQAGLRGDKPLVAELTAGMKKKLPYGITDFCRDEIGMKKLLTAVSQGRTSIDGRRLELLLRHHREELKKLLERLPDDELAKWR